MSYNASLQTNNDELQALIEIVNALPEPVEQATPTIEVGNNGLITATAGDKSATKQLETQAAKTVVPSTSAQTVVESGVYTTGDIVVSAMPVATQATPSISIDANGKITASATQTEGYVSAGTKSATKQLTVQAAQTITPGTTDKTIASGKYLTGTQTIKGDTNLVAENIISGKSIFGVAGTATTGTQLPELTTPAFESEVFEGSEYIDQTGTKKTGTFTIENELSEQDELLTELESILSRSASKSETWILTLKDGTTVEKVVQLYD